MHKETEEQNFSFVAVAKEEQIMKNLESLPLEKWGRLAGSNSYVTYSLAPYGINIGYRLLEEDSKRKEVYEVSFFFIQDSMKNPERKIFSGKRVEELYKKLYEADSKKQIRLFKDLQTLAEETI